MRSIPAAGRAGALIAAFCTLCLASVSIAQTPSSPPSVWEPGGAFDFNGLTQEEASHALAAFQQRMRFVRHFEQLPTIQFTHTDIRHLQVTTVMGYRFIQFRDGVTHENWVMLNMGFTRGAERNPRWASSDTCPQISTVIENFRQLPPHGSRFFRAWPTLATSGANRAGL